MRTASRLALSLIALLFVPPVSRLYAADEPPTCQGLTATVVGPTEADGRSTVGTERDDVIVAPIGPTGRVEGLSGNDTICLINWVNPDLNVTGVVVLAGPGDDAVSNETNSLVSFVESVGLGPGANTFVGADYAEQVYGNGAAAESTDIDIDHIDTGGGNDRIFSGTSGVPNRDVISTGAGEDDITYAGLAGAAIDNGPDADWLRVVDRWEGELTIDNRARKATVGSQPVLTWTAVQTFWLRAAPGAQASFVGNDTDESLRITGPVHNDAVRSTIDTGAGDDDVDLAHYLPTSIDTGAGRDQLYYTGCNRAHVELGVGPRASPGPGPRCPPSSPASRNSPAGQPSR